MKARRHEGTKARRSGSVRPSWLCVAYAFPPINRSGTHRTLAFVRHLDRLGWDATVLTVHAHDEAVDAVLEAQVPPSTTVIRTNWAPLTRCVRACVCPWGRGRRSERLPGRPDETRAESPSKGTAASVRTFCDWASRLLLTPDSRLGWVPSALWAARTAIRRHRPQAVYSTSPYMSAHLIALIVARWTGLPWVADFRDPWRGNPFRDLAYRSLETWDAWLEAQVFRTAARIVCNTEALQANLAERLPWTASKSVTIPNGYDADLVAAVQPLRTVDRDKFVMVHCGNFYGPRSPMTLFSALRRVVDQSPDVGRRVRLLLMGNDSYEGDSLRALSGQLGVEDQVEVLGVRPHDEALGLMRGADASVVVGFAGPGSELQVPNKLYESLAVRSPILALAPRGSAIARVLTRASADHLLCDPRDEAQIAASIERMVLHRGGFVDRPWSGVEQYDRARSAELLARIFHEIAGIPCARSTVNDRPRHVRRDDQWKQPHAEQATVRGKETIGSC